MNFMANLNDYVEQLEIRLKRCMILKKRLELYLIFFLVKKMKKMLSILNKIERKKWI